MRLKILGVVSHQTLIISLQNWVKGILILTVKSVQLIALNLPVVFRYMQRLQVGMVDGVQKFSCLDIIICDHTKVITQLVYYTNKKKFHSLNQPATYIIYIDTLNSLAL